MEERHHNQKKIYKISLLCRHKTEKTLLNQQNNSKVTDSKGFDGTGITINKI